MTVTSEVSTDPGFVGLYKYTVSGSWNVTQFGLSHLDIFIELEDCACKCDSRVFKFADPAGMSDGGDMGEPCTVFYEGQYVCKGDPSIPSSFAGPTVKFNTIDSDCEAKTIGTGTWVFYSPFPPAPFSVHADAVAIKHGQGVCTGDLTGTLPVCDCSVPATPSTWGKVKSSYR